MVSILWTILYFIILIVYYFRILLIYVPYCTPQQNNSLIFILIYNRLKINIKNNTVWLKYNQIIKIDCTTKWMESAWLKLLIIKTINQSKKTNLTTCKNGKKRFLSDLHKSLMSDNAGSWNLGDLHSLLI